MIKWISKNRCTLALMIFFLLIGLTIMGTAAIDNIIRYSILSWNPVGLIIYSFGVICFWIGTIILLYLVKKRKE